jgi:hypothetical protein
MGSGVRMVVLVAVLFCVVGTTSGSAAIPDPKQKVLRRTDLPGWFAVKSARYVNNETARREDEGTPRNDYRSLGRVSGYEIRFARTRLFGLLVVQSTANVYKSVAAARAALQLDARRIAKGTYGRRFTPWRFVLPGGPLGDESRFYSGRTRNQNGTHTDSIILWTFGRLYSSLWGAGPGGTVNGVEMIDMVRKQQARAAAR